MGLSNDLSCEAGSLSCCRPNPHSVFNQRFEALFPLTGALGCAVCFAPRRLSSLSVCECGAAGCYPPLFLPRSSHTLPVSVLPWPLESSLPRLPVSAPPTGQDECLFFISLVLDFLAIQFSVSSGCARRRSVSTYAAILVLCTRYLNVYPIKVSTRKVSRIVSFSTIILICLRYDLISISRYILLF